MNPNQNAPKQKSPAGLLSKVIQARISPPQFSARTPQFSIRRKVVVPGSMMPNMNRVV